MSDQEAAKAKLIAEGFPAELFEPLKRIMKIRQHINVRILPRDAWAVVALLQFADRNPALGPEQHDQLHMFAEQMIEALVNIETGLEKYILQGWDAANDVPINRREG